MHASMARKPEVSHEPALGHGQRVLLYDACCLQQPIRCRQTCGSQPACPTPVIHPRDCSRFSAVCTPMGRACPQVDHTRRPSPRRAFMRRFCLDPGPYGCTKGYLRNNTVLYCTYTTYTMCSVHRPVRAPRTRRPLGVPATTAPHEGGAAPGAPTAQGRQGG